MSVIEAPELKVNARVCVDTGADMTICSHVFIIKKFGEKALKTFVKENWYKLMIGSSMFVFSVSALIYSVSPARAENVFKAKSNSTGADTHFLVDSEDGVWYVKTGDPVSAWKYTGRTL
jgi:hypothetical protein